MLEIKNYSKSYAKGQKAVDNISLEVKKGDIFGFVGHLKGFYFIYSCHFFNSCSLFALQGYSLKTNKYNTNPN